MGLLLRARSQQWGEGVWLWLGGYLYLAHTPVSRTPKPPGIRELSAPMGGGEQMQPLTSPAPAVTHFYFGKEVERFGVGWGGGWVFLSWRLGVGVRGQCQRAAELIFFSPPVPAEDSYKTLACATQCSCLLLMFFTCCVELAASMWASGFFFFTFNPPSYACVSTGLWRFQFGGAAHPALRAVTDHVFDFVCEKNKERKKITRKQLRQVAPTGQRK